MGILKKIMGGGNNKCMQCRQKVYGRDEYIKKVEKMGWTVSPESLLPFPPNNYREDASTFKETVDDLVNHIRAKCQECDAVFCLECISNAHDHTHGGKACLKCGGKIKRYEVAEEDGADRALRIKIKNVSGHAHQIAFKAYNNKEDCFGKSSKEIAAILFVSETTVHFHRKNLRDKLGLKNRRVNLRTFLLSKS